jgi:cytochrome b561
MLFLGYYMVDVPRGTPERAFYLNLHKSLGILTGLLILVRIGWRLTHPPPPMPASMPAWEIRAARWNHRVLYLCMIVQVATGYISSSFNKFGIKFFGLPLPSWGWEDKALRELFAGIHHVFAVIFIIAITLHVLAAFKHLLLDRDKVFQRMLP